MSSIKIVTPPPPEKFRQGSFDFSLKRQARLPKNEPDWLALTRNGSIRLVQTLRWMIQNKLAITKAKLDENFHRPDKGVWSWGQTLRKLSSISKELYGANGDGKPLRSVYRFNKTSYFDGEYIFLMNPREILTMLKEYEKKRRETKGGADA